MKRRMPKSKTRYIPNKQLRPQIIAGLKLALTEIDLRIETAAKAELYPGHGKITGFLQRSIFGEPARVEGGRVKGRVGARGVRYALPIHRRYKYLHKALEKVRPQAPAIVRKHTSGH
jgi:hypothetical protein